jgi:hypothetical protein
MIFTLRVSALHEPSSGVIFSIIKGALQMLHLLMALFLIMHYFGHKTLVHKLKNTHES